MEYLQLKNLFVCMDKTNKLTNLQKTIFQVLGSGAPANGYLNASHLVYDHKDFDDEISRGGYTVQESEITFPLDESTFNPLDLACYETDQGEFFVFKDLAVWNTGDGLEVFCKADMTLSDLTAHWKLEDALGESSLSNEYRVSNDHIGELAIRTERLQYESWDALYRAPGEMLEGEERLESLSNCCAHLAGGGDLSDFIEQVEESMQAIIDMYSEDELADYTEENKRYYGNLAVQAKNYLKTAHELLDESKHLAAEIKAAGGTACDAEHENLAQGMSMGGIQHG